MSRQSSLRPLAAALSVLALLGAGLLTTGQTASSAEPAFGAEPRTAASAPAGASIRAPLRSAARPVRTGRLHGRVVSGTTPIHRAAVTVVGRVHRTRLTGPAGHFHLRLRTGHYRLIVTAPGLTTAHLRVHIRRHQRTRRLVHLPPVPYVTLSGRVLDGSGHGWPLYARVAVDGGAVHQTLWTDPVTGRWALRVPSGTSYRLATSVAYAGYQSPVSTVAVGGVSLDHDVVVPVDPVQCWIAPGYESLQGPGHDGPCRLLPGGLLVGTVTSEQSRVGLTNTQVVAAAQRTVTAPTISRPSGSHGGYALFLSVGSHTVAYSRPLYAPLTRTVVISGNRITASDVALASGHVVASPASISASARSGSAPVTSTVTLTNDGTADAQISVDESRAGVGGVSTPPTSPTWQDLPDLPVAVTGNATAVPDGVLYSVGGSRMVGGSWQPTSAAYAYSPGNGWTRIADILRPLTDLNVGAVDGRLVVNGGSDADGNGYYGTEIYDPDTDTWVDGSAVAQEKDLSGQAVLGDDLYVIAGCGETGCETWPDPEVEAYDVPDNTVRELALYPGGQEQPLCGGLDGRIYCVGGDYSATNGNAPAPTAASFVYDPSSDHWSPIASPPVTISVAAVAVAAGRLVLSGGYQDGQPSDRTWSYDPGTDTWTELPSSGQTISGGGGACGYYRVGGIGVGGNPVATVQHLTGYDACGDAGVDVDWLTPDTRTLTLAPGASAVVTVSLDPSSLDIGTYTAALRIGDDAPGTVPLVPITFDVVSPCLTGHRSGSPAVVGPNC